MLVFAFLDLTLVLLAFSVSLHCKLLPCLEISYYSSRGKMFSCLRKGRKGEQETPFIKNGRLLLEEAIASCNGKCNPIRAFSSKELAKATENYHHQHIIVWDSDFKLYKGFLHDRPISVKKYCSFSARSGKLLELAITDIVTGSQMSAHRNVLRVIGCCLETEIPILVYEFAGSNALSDHIFYNCSKPLSWKSRIEIAIDIASAISYLHTALSRTVVLRDLRPSIIILGEDSVPKLADFSLSIHIPEGDSHIMTDLVGRIGCSAPEYMGSGYLTEKLDVYYFGLFLLQLLTAENICSSGRGGEIHFLPDHVVYYVDNQKLIEIIDPTILNDDTEQQELLAFAKLGLRCMSNEAEERPAMIDVAKELGQIYQSVPPMQ